MDLPATEPEWLLDEVGDEYRVGAGGEREYAHPVPGGDAGYDAWKRKRIEEALREADDPKAVWVDHEIVERESKAWAAALPSDEPQRH